MHGVRAHELGLLAVIRVRGGLMASRPVGQRLPKLVQSGTNSRLDRSERLLQPRRHLGVRQLGEERSLDRLSLVRREDPQGGSQRPALLLELQASWSQPPRSSPWSVRPGSTRFCRCSKRNRSMALERAWFMIHPRTVPFPAS